MRIVFIGDVVGSAGRRALAAVLPSVRRDYNADLAIVNGENSADGNGIDARSAQSLYDAGADVITTGNHSFRKSSAAEEYERRDTLLRPANFGGYVPGKGVCELDFGSYSAAVVNLIGTAYMQPADNPFKCAEELLKDISSKIVIVDFHAEATSEKRAMGFFLAGRVSAVFGTHTHVQTADEEIIDGTGYLTDVGMTGVHNSVLGADKDVIIEKFLTYYPKKYVGASGECDVCGVFTELDNKSGKCLRLERFCRKFNNR